MGDTKIMAETDRTIITQGWPYDEKSTRNCIHCKVCLRDGKPKAYCEYNHLSEKVFTDHNPDYEDVYRYAISLVTVVRSRTWASSVCRNCSLFEHDEEE